MNRFGVVVIVAFGGGGCSATPPMPQPQVIPAVEYSNAVQRGVERDFSIFNVADRSGEAEPKVAVIPPSNPAVNSGANEQVLRYVNQGFVHRGGLAEPSRAPNAIGALPPGSNAPYMRGHLSSNPSLWPDDGQANFLYRDVRAFQPMDIVTIVINERSEGRKKAETDSETNFSLLLAIKSFFGLETKSWASNNEGLDPTSLVSASSESKFEGQGETKRSGALTARLSAVVLETLPNGLLRVEGSKIVSVDREEEVMVISGLVRPRDIAANNEVDSSRVANMRIDFYGRGVIGDTTSPGWLARIFTKVWPF